ncbi:MAG TPA: DUF3343 domain-containing protein [Candidatus Fimadaptatus faecigallinarum]|uniref:DUF3343 domain-containing protein n=1 Tax=Candidatus Fimadaptatus faecigallinarum TaxID=2840814 RepID=A0A9D1S4H0_9FIRM|nr:DUF3343 domain-containing protein [Candidatus Fimadaptatus faecigallinarum]
MDNAIAIASFRSRQQVMNFESQLKRAGIRAEVVSTPRDIAVGCGLSVKFDMADLSRVKELCRAVPPQNMIGIYRADRGDGGRFKVRFTPVAGARGY